jgi:hypothetical protein
MMVVSLQTVCTYKDKAAYKAREKTKKTGNIFEGRLAKEKRAAKASEAQGKANAGATSRRCMLQKACSNLRKTERMLELCQERKDLSKKLIEAATKEGKSKFLLEWQRLLNY